MKKIIVLTYAMLLAVALAACGAQTTDKSPSSNGAAADPNAQQLHIVATSFQFDKAEYHVNKGQPVAFTFDSKQGMHSAEIKDLNVKLDTTKKSTTFTPDQAGTYEIRCMIPCGQGHVNMVSKLVVE